MSGDVTIGALKRLTTLMAGQDIDSVDVNGGAIDGTPIGAASASTGAFSTLSATGALTNSVIETATTSAALAVNGVSLVSATAAQTYPVPLPTAGCFKYIRVTNATTSRKVTLSSTASGAKFGSASDTTVVMSNTDDALSLRGETSARWGVYGVKEGSTAITFA